MAGGSHNARTHQAHTTSTPEAAENDFPPCIVASSNRFNDIAPYVTWLYENEYYKFRDILPWDFPQSATKTVEDTFLRQYFDEQEIHMQGGAHGAGNGFRFLKQVWYTTAIWNAGTRIPAVANWWWEQEHNRDICNDRVMLDWICNPDAKSETFFEPNEIDLYGQKFLKWVVKHIQVDALNHKARLDEKASRLNTVPGQVQDAAKEVTNRISTQCVEGESMQLSAKSHTEPVQFTTNHIAISAEAQASGQVNDVVQPLNEVRSGHTHDQAKDMNLQGHLNNHPQNQNAVSRSNHALKLDTSSVTLAAQGRGSDNKPVMHENSRIMSGSSSLSGEREPLTAGHAEFNRYFLTPRLLSVTPANINAVLSHDFDRTTTPLNDRTNHGMQYHPEAAPFSHGGFTTTTKNTEPQQTSQGSRGGSIRGQGRGGRGRNNGNRSSFGEYNSSGPVSQDKSARKSPRDAGVPNANHNGTKFRRGSGFGDQSWRSASMTLQSHSAVPAQTHRQFSGPHSMQSEVFQPYPVNVAAFQGGQQNLNAVPYQGGPGAPGVHQGVFHRQLPPHLQVQLGEQAHTPDANSVSPNYIGSERFEVHTLILFSVSANCRDEDIVRFFQAREINVAAIRRNKPPTYHNQQGTIAVFVTFGNHNDARRALALNGMVLFDRTVRIEVSREYWDPEHHRFKDRYLSNTFPLGQRSNGPPDVNRFQSDRHDGTWTTVAPEAFGDAYALPPAIPVDAGGYSRDFHPANSPSTATQADPYGDHGLTTASDAFSGAKNPRVDASLDAKTLTSDVSTPTASGTSTPKKTKKKQHKKHNKNGNWDKKSKSLLGNSVDASSADLTADASTGRSEIVTTPSAENIPKQEVPVADKDTQPSSTDTSLKKNAKEETTQSHHELEASPPALEEKLTTTTVSTTVGAAENDPASSCQNQTIEGDQQVSMDDLVTPVIKEPLKPTEEQRAAAVRSSAALPTIDEGQELRTPYAHVDSDLYDDSFHTARASPPNGQNKALVETEPAGESANDSEETVQQVDSTPTPDIPKPASLDIHIANDISPSSKGVAFAKVSTTELNEPHSASAASIPPTPGTVFHTAPSTPIEPNAAFGSDKIDHSKLFKKHEKQKGPSQTESLSMFGRKQEKGKKKQTKSKGSIKGKQRDFMSESSGSHGSRSVSAAATPMAPAESPTEWRAKDRAQDTPTATLPSSTASEQPPVPTKSPNASPSKLKGGAFKLFGLLSTKSSEPSPETVASGNSVGKLPLTVSDSQGDRAEASSGNNASLSRNVAGETFAASGEIHIDTLAKAVEVENETKPVAHHDTEETNETDAREDILVGLGISSVDHREDDKGEGKKKRKKKKKGKGKRRSASEEGAQATVHNQESALSLIPGRIVARTTSGFVPPGQSQDDDADEWSDASMSPTATLFPASTVMLPQSQSKKRTMIINKEPKHLVEPSPPRNAHKRKISGKSAPEESETSVKILHLAEARIESDHMERLMSVNQQLTILVSDDNEGEGEHDATGRSRDVVYLFMPADPKTSVGRSSSEVSEVDTVEHRILEVVESDEEKSEDKGEEMQSVSTETSPSDNELVKEDEMVLEKIFD